MTAYSVTCRAVVFLTLVAASSLFVGCSGSDGTAKSAAKPVDVATAPGIALNYRITGMTCGGCAASIQDTVAALEGVNGCEVSFEKGSAIVKVNDAALASTVEKAITDLKFTAERIEG